MDASRNASSKPNPAAWLTTYASEHFLKLFWFGSLGFGLLWLLAFFLTIDYFPNFDLQAGANVLLYLTFVGAILSILFSLAFLFPSLYICYAIRGKAPLSANHRFRLQLVGWNFFVFFSFLILTALIALFSYLSWDSHYALLCYFSSVLGVAGVSAKLWRARKFRAVFKVVTGREVRTDKRDALINRLCLIRALHFMAIGALQVFPCLLLLKVVLSASDLASDDYWGLLRIGPYWALAMAIAGGIALDILLPRSNRRRAPVIVPVLFLLPLVLTVSAQAGGMFPMMLAQCTKIGNFRADRIVVAAKACPILANALSVNCEEEKTALQLCNVHVVSRIGTETYLRLTNKGGQGDRHQIINVLLPSADVESIELNPNKQNLKMAGINKELEERNSLCNPDVSMLTLMADNAFDFDSLIMSEEGKKALLPLIRTALISAENVERISVIGHADRIGPEQYNNLLAHQRAEQVQIYIDRGLRNVSPKPKVDVLSKGSLEPLAKKCETGKNRISCEAPNRRVDVFIHFKDGLSPDEKNKAGSAPQKAALSNVNIQAGASGV